MTPTFTVLVGSAGRPSLKQTLESVHRQPRVPGDQVIIAFDALDMAVDTLEQNVTLVESFGEGFVACAFNAGYHWYGIEQINHALRTLPITGSHVFTLGDDDVFTDDAYATLRPLCAADPTRPILYQFVAPWREILWDVPTMQRSRISGCCIAAPRAYVGPFPTRQYQEHDFDWMLEILRAAPRTALWLDRVLVIARPDVRGDDVAHRGIWRCHACTHFRYLEDVDQGDPFCPRCRARLTPLRQMVSA